MVTAIRFAYDITGMRRKNAGCNADNAAGTLAGLGQTQGT